MKFIPNPKAFNDSICLPYWIYYLMSHCICKNFSNWFVKQNYFTGTDLIFQNQTILCQNQTAMISFAILEDCLWKNKRDGFFNSSPVSY
jgi:hypothetical protein